ncbi:hypothetical protein HDU96_008673, partial [Phlyctochytrium bullatum]
EIMGLVMDPKTFGEKHTRIAESALATFSSRKLDQAAEAATDPDVEMVLRKSLTNETLGSNLRLAKITDQGYVSKSTWDRISEALADADSVASSTPRKPEIPALPVEKPKGMGMAGKRRRQEPEKAMAFPTRKPIRRLSSFESLARRVIPLNAKGAPEIPQRPTAETISRLPSGPAQSSNNAPITSSLARQNSFAKPRIASSDIERLVAERSSRPPGGPAQSSRNDSVVPSLSRKNSFGKPRNPTQEIEKDNQNLQEK